MADQITEAEAKAILIKNIEKCTFEFYKKRYTECKEKYTTDCLFLLERVSDNMITKEYYDNHREIMDAGLALAVEARTVTKWFN